ncbi:deleted in malignant brain tumors 1 protein [Gambusia affinis]|uniref:deleted in malignant brain tumors 1 protein n=1 Tax=Gambusia affinis TaxID=33528 RepID=UPI001CDD1A02|nr:deleted in malignant brain tumors 1 protein [Gambusia affinis]
MLRFLRVILTGLLGFLFDGVGAFGVGTYGGVRVVNGDHHCSGRVEVNLHEKWGTICDHDWDMQAASVVCSELGCGFAESASRGGEFGPGGGLIALRSVHCKGHESSLIHCDAFINRNSFCTHQNDAGVKCSGTLMEPRLSVLSPHYVFSAGESVHFYCNIQPRDRVSNVHLYKHGVETPLVTQSADPTQIGVSLVLSDVETFQQGSYSCQYNINGGFPPHRITSPTSHPVNITVVDLLTPHHWYNTSSEAPTGSVIKGEGFNITCSTLRQYPGASFQLRLVRSNGTVRQSLPAVSQSVTFTFPNAQNSNEGYYYCLYRVQLGGRTFVSRESQPLPIAIKDPDPLLSPMVISWLVSGVTFVIAVIIIFTVAKVMCNKEKKPSELERETRTCVDNTYVALSVNKL